jgi:hypothetical protein
MMAAPTASTWAPWAKMNGQIVGWDETTFSTDINMWLRVGLNIEVRGVLAII